MKPNMLNTFARLLASVAVVATLASCAGTDFKRPTPEALVVGKSTQSDVLRVMGTPTATGETVRNGEKLEVLRYAFGSGVSNGKYPGVTPARAEVFLTHGGLLVCDEFVSSFAEDATDWDDSKVASIVKGKTTRNEVVALLGKPNGTAIHPFVKVQGESAAIYSYSHVTGSVFNMKQYSQVLVVSFGSDGVVTDVEYSSNGTR